MKILKTIFFTLFLSTALATEKKFIPLSPNQGIEQFKNSEFKSSYWQLMRYYEMQKNNTFCGVASAVMILNSLDIPRPTAPQFGYPFFTQEDFFTYAVERLVPEENVKKRGMTLDQLELALKCYDVTVTKYRADFADSNLFRAHLRETLSKQDEFLVINFYRPSIGQEGFGHFSPVAAFDQESDSVLVIDVFRYKYPPFWVKVDDLHASMLPHDRETNQTRGYLIISRSV
ncbi:MAG: phytochelatin synthase family protein [Chlamydiales bacterium]